MVNWSACTKHTLPFNCNNTKRVRRLLKVKKRKARVSDVLMMGKVYRRAGT